jgi:hypothetical protein
VLAPRNLDYIENNKNFDANYSGILQSMRFFLDQSKAAVIPHLCGHHASLQ